MSKTTRARHTLEFKLEASAGGCRGGECLPASGWQAEANRDHRQGRDMDLPRTSR